MTLPWKPPPTDPGTPPTGPVPGPVPCDTPTRTMKASMTATNQQSSEYKIGLDQLIDRRNDIVAMEISDPDCGALRDNIVFALDILTQVLIEHFPLLAESTGKIETGA